MVNKFQCKKCGTFVSESAYIISGNRCPTCDSEIDEIEQMWKRSNQMSVKKLKTIVLLLTLTMLMGSMIYGVNAERIWKYSELANLSIEEFVASMYVNVTTSLNDIETANQTHDYDTIVRSAYSIDRNTTLMSDTWNALNKYSFYEKADMLRDKTDFLNAVIRPPYIDIVHDAKARVEERDAEIAEQERKRISQEYMDTLNASQSQKQNTVSIAEEFGDYTLDGQDAVRVNVKKGTDVVHMMAMEELPTEYGYTRDSAQYTVTSTGDRIKGYIDYTLDGYVAIIQPRNAAMTKGEFMDILNTFRRTA